MARDITFSFDGKSEAAQRAAEKTAAKKIVEISKETERNIRNLVSQAIRDGIPPREAANAIEPLIGLTAAQGQAALKYRQRLIEQGLPADKVQSKLEQYADDKLAERADTIARTEILDALNDGQNEAWQQAQDAGLLSKEATKIPILADDACEICQGIAAEGPVPISQDFSTPGPPFHPRCRCSEAIDTP